MSRFLRSLVVQMESIIEGKLITKDKRHELFGQVAGGSNSMKPEEYQRSKIVEITEIPCPKTKMRINLRTSELKLLARPNVAEDGFDYSEDFDGTQTLNGVPIYINLKCIVGIGGAQTRSLREVYWFVNGQINVLKNKPDIYFANILDGDEACSNMDKFRYRLNQEDETIKSRIYVGDLKGYFSWFRNLKGEIQ